MDQRLGKAVRAAREEAGLSVSGLARRAGVAKAYISMIENHRLGGVPSGKVLARIEAALADSVGGGEAAGTVGTVGKVGGELVRAGQWEAAPRAVRERVEAAERRAKRGERLALWLRDHAQRRKGGEGGKDLDALYRSGQLSRRVRDVLEPDEARDPGEPSPAAAKPSTHQSAIVRGVACRRVPLVNKVAAGRPMGFTDLDYPADIADEYVPLPAEEGESHRSMFAARVNGDSMEPDYHDGEVVVFSEAVDAVSGRDCFVRLVDADEMTFKRVYFEDAAGRVLEGDAGGAATHVRLQPLNEAYEASRWDRDAVAAVYRAVWRMTRV